MLEELCRNSFYTACSEKKHMDGLVYLKGRPKPEKRLKDFAIDSYLSYDWHFLPLQKLSRKHKGSVELKAWRWFNKNADKIRDAFIEKKYGGDLELAMIQTGSFGTLFEEFKTYFAERRNAFMERTEHLMQIGRAELAKQGKTPQSHGGVANLLKVLTKTMQGQGSTMETIAKVQYTVCMQAGIYIPDEFLTDVLTAMDIMEGNT